MIPSTDENPQHSSQIRLECLKLAHRADQSPEEVIAKARMYLAWVGGVGNQTTPQGPGDRSKESTMAPTVTARTSPKKTAASAA